MNRHCCCSLMENKPKKTGNMKLYVESSLQEMTIAVNYVNHGMPVLIAKGAYLFCYIVKS
jgi:hypothetical protein